nr:GNAT family N-acetyltransferase [Sphingomicrobium nitratireducens]
MILRGFVAEDFAAHKAILDKPDVYRHLGNQPETHENLWRRTVSSVGQWIVMGFGGWMVTLKADGRVIGNVGLFDGQRQLAAGFDGQPEMGWIFDPDMHGQGLAREACDAVLEWADANLAREIWAIIAPGNAPSLKLADRLGFEQVETNQYHDEPIVVLKRTFPR